MLVDFNADIVKKKSFKFLYSLQIGIWELTNIFLLTFNKPIASLARNSIPIVYRH